MLVEVVEVVEVCGGRGRGRGWRAIPTEPLKRLRAPLKQAFGRPTWRRRMPRPENVVGTGAAIFSTFVTRRSCEAKHETRARSATGELLQQASSTLKAAWGRNGAKAPVRASSRGRGAARWREGAQTPPLAHAEAMPRARSTPAV